VLDSEAMVVAFRDPQLTPVQAEAVRRWSLAQVGTRYNTLGVVLSAPFVVNRRLCEVPWCRGPCATPASAASPPSSSAPAATTASSARSSCSRPTGRPVRPLSDVDPRWVSPADLLHMREGDVATLAAARPLRYVGHLKYTAPTVAVTDAP
jgi:hypothetical protein